MLQTMIFIFSRSLLMLPLRDASTALSTTTEAQGRAAVRGMVSVPHPCLAETTIYGALFINENHEKKTNKEEERVDINNVETRMS